MHTLYPNINLGITSHNAYTAYNTKYQTILPCREVPIREKLHVLGRRSTPSTLPLKQTLCKNAS